MQQCHEPPAAGRLLGGSSFVRPALLAAFSLLILLALGLRQPWRRGGSADAAGAAALAAAADQATGSAAAAPSAASSSGPITPPPGCLLLERVCVDQQQVVMQDPVYLPSHPQQRPLPSFESRLHYNIPSADAANTDIYAENAMELPPVLFRARTTREPAADLRDPVFDNATLPLLFFAEWHGNFGHTLGNSAAWLHAHLHLANASWASRAALVLATPLGLAMPGHWQPLVGPLVPARPIQSWADFSARPPPGGARRGGGSARPRSRCFQQMLVCAGSGMGEALNISQAAQALVEINAPLPPPPVAFNSCSAGSPADEQATCLRVLWLTRPPKPDTRQVLNLAELLQRCSAWRYTDPASGKAYAASCATFQPSRDLPANMAAMRGADVVVGTHGASMANAFFANPGTGMVEVFTDGWTWQVHRSWLDQEALPALRPLWWGLTVQDPAAFEPGEFERLLPHPRLYKGWQGKDKQRRDQNIRVPWSGVERLLQGHAAVLAAGGLPAYLGLQGRNKTVHYFARKGGHTVPDLP